MEKIKLYVDFDGVILDTINLSYQMIEELGISGQENIQKFYRTINWDNLLKKATEIQNSIDNLKKILDSELFDVEILTHVNSDSEALAKKDYMSKKISSINVIPVPRNIEKCNMVDPSNAILIDDFLPNLDLWEEKGGIGIKFSDNGKKCKFTTITSLDQIIELYSFN